MVKLHTAELNLKRQFDLFGSLLAVRPDAYAYVTLTAPEVPRGGALAAMRRFADRLQALDDDLLARFDEQLRRAVTDADGLYVGDGWSAVL